MTLNDILSFMKIRNLMYVKYVIKHLL
ncbi:unnamed protein product [Larinioides sclopetarius]|uniref:Uncharacterized protein n=2 Tax=Larinioides sclopetarius TaxID=280406 RepID=A0AAV1ZF77_9ARAC